MGKHRMASALCISVGKWPIRVCQAWVKTAITETRDQRFETKKTPAQAPSYMGNAVHAVHTQCEFLDVGKYSDPTFGPF